MATLYPSLDAINKLKVPPTDGERTLLNFLLNVLDNTYEIYYQPLLNGDNPDIAILRRNSGVLIIEVKDWNLSNYYLDDNRDWCLNKNNSTIESPFKQVEKYKSRLFNLHSEALYDRVTENRRVWSVVNCAVYFHNVQEVELNKFLFEGHNSYENRLDYIGIFSPNSLTEENIQSYFNKTWMNKKSIYFDETLYKSIKRYLKPPIHNQEEGKDIVYTKEQQELIRSEIRPRRKIKGVAGSGKTLVLAKRAVNAFKRTNSRVLILTYNISLVNYIRDRISDVRETFEWSSFYIINYHQFFKAEANNHNLKVTLSSWEDNNFFESVKNSIVKFDAIFIDEIQDFKQSWIDLIFKYFAHDNTEVAVFGDEKQNVYGRDLDANNEPIVRTIRGEWNKSLRLSHRFDNTIGIITYKFQQAFLEGKYTIDKTPQYGIDYNKDKIVEYHYFHSYSLDILVDYIYSILISREIHSSDVGLLSAKVELIRELDFLIRTKKNEQTKVTFESKEEFDECKGLNRTIENIRRRSKLHFYMKSGTIKLSTIYSFKGWEIDTLFLFIEQGSTEDIELIYTGLTRAKRNLIIFNLGNLKYHSFFQHNISNTFENI